INNWLYLLNKTMFQSNLWINVIITFQMPLRKTPLLWYDRYMYNLFENSYFSRVYNVWLSIVSNQMKTLQYAYISIVNILSSSYVIRIIKRSYIYERCGV